MRVQRQNPEVPPGRSPGIYLREYKETAVTRPVVNVGIGWRLQQQLLAAQAVESTRVNGELVAPVRPDRERVAIRRPDRIAIRDRIESESSGDVASHVVDPDVGSADALVLDRERDATAVR